MAKKAEKSKKLNEYGFDENEEGEEEDEDGEKFRKFWKIGYFGPKSLFLGKIIIIFSYFYNFYIALLFFII